ncbi:MAG: outer membrane protein assembly factor BamA [Gammaproteobacteria bacterium]|nr:outer membrane protein assembly factor BamA [Gammaproteobacteria bacterium]
MHNVYAATFVVEDIRVEGIQRISAGTVFTYLPVKVGDEFSESQYAETIRAVYKSGYFNDIRLERQGNILIVSVQERPAIASITFSGNKEFDNDELKVALKDIGLAEGRVYNKSVLDKVEQELRRQYYSHGKYSVRIQSTVTPLERNRVGIGVDVSEGLVAKIKEINIIGNETYDEEELKKQFELTVPTWYSFFSKDDQYSKQKLAADLEKLSSYYLDRGFLKFNIDSTQVSITPDKKDIYITINVTEGEQYSVEEVKISGKLLYPDDELFRSVQVRAGDIFSRRAIVASTDALTDLMGNDGYAFANVNAIPDLDEEKKTVSLTFFIDPGRRIYVRRINVAGNSRTRDEVLRREMRQIENAWMSTKDVERSRTRLERLGYFTEINVETPAVPENPDQVDVNFSVTEQPSGQLLAGIGYSQSQGFLLNSSISQDNFLGSGVKFGVNFSTSEADEAYGISYTNPYYTTDGISRGFSILYRSRDGEELGISDYTTDVLSGKLNYGFPISETNTIFVSLGYENLELKPAFGAPREIRQFVVDNGDTYDNVIATASWVDDNRNRSALFADRGTYTSISGEVSSPGSDLEYYKITARHQRFFPLTRNSTLSLNGEIGFGDGYGDLDDLPFYEHYFAGGVSSVRGFEDNSLGPKDSTGEPFGGDFRLVANAEVILPMPFVSKDDKAWRMTAFMDAGNVFTEAGDFDAGDLRYSAGLGVRWLSPFGPIKASFAEPLNDKSEDDVQNFQFTFGSTF